MKRHQSIVPLSRDHHTGLLCSWKIRQGIQKQVEVKRMQDYVAYFWKHHLEPHFKEEETLLYNTVQDALFIRAMEEHAALQLLIKELSQTPSVKALAAFADLLEQHIRFEERTVFPHIEKIFSPSLLNEIGEKIKTMHATQEPDSFEDDFWTVS